MHPAKLSDERLLADCSVTRTRGSGPGGQHRNKVETAIVVEHLATGIRGEASERRSQTQNRRQAIFRLRVKLAVEVRGEIDSQPSDRWQQRVAERRISVSAAHDDFPALLAEALDVLRANDHQLPPSAQWLGVSTSQLVKLLKVEPRALGRLNQLRQQRGEPPLR